ncbi:hypothetical protein ALC53_03650 [Atta colombica]|uniref:Uncharacterized protein n=1 Tax=Atta colombica TaxID=520822 RepID=A0A195BMB0_9HYME|nr:hypothetical protein ALC53_03650 [Atta colombica]
MDRYSAPSSLPATGYSGLWVPHHRRPRRERRGDENCCCATLCSAKPLLALHFTFRL